MENMNPSTSDRSSFSGMEGDVESIPAHIQGRKAEPWTGWQMEKINSETFISWSIVDDSGVSRFIPAER